MKILILYGTTEGQTRKIAHFIKQTLENAGHQIVVADAAEDAPNPNQFDAVLIGSSVHIHRYHSAIKHYIDSHAKTLNETPSLFFSVSMAIASQIEQEHREIKQLAQTFVEQSNWHPLKIIHIAGALKYTQYDYFKRLIMRMIAKKEGGSTDTHADHEYTNWSQLEEEIKQFISTI